MRLLRRFGALIFIVSLVPVARMLPAVADPYPPPPPCAVSFGPGAQDAGGTELVASGLGAYQVVRLTQRPNVTALGSFRADRTGGLVVRVRLRQAVVDDATFVTAVSPLTSCSTSASPPNASSSGTPTSGGASSTALPSGSASVPPSGGATGSTPPAGTTGSTPVGPSPIAGPPPPGTTGLGSGVPLGVIAIIAVSLLLTSGAAALLLTRRGR